MGKRLALSFAFAATLISSTVGQITSIQTNNAAGFDTLYTVKSEALKPSTQQPVTDSIVERAVVKTKKTATVTKKEMTVWATAYASQESQTDDTPFITASGAFVYDGVIAANFLPLGTKVTIPDVFGDKVFTVEDRMNQRYNNQNIIDIWFASNDTAHSFGKKIVTINVL